MLAQDAIEIMESDLKELKEIKHRKQILRDTIGERYKKLCDEIEALSIVLESAKLFHKHTIPMLESRHKELGMEYNSKTVFRVPLENVGIEEGADV